MPAATTRSAHAEPDSYRSRAANAETSGTRTPLRQSPSAARKRGTSAARKRGSSAARSRDRAAHSRETVLLKPEPAGKLHGKTTVRLIVSEALEEARKRERSRKRRPRGSAHTGALHGATRKLTGMAGGTAVFTTAVMRRSWEASGRRMKMAIVTLAFIASVASGVAFAQYQERLGLEGRIRSIQAGREQRVQDVTALDERLASLRAVDPDSPELWALIGEISALEGESQSGASELAAAGIAPEQFQSPSEARLREVLAAFGARDRDIPVVCLERVQHFVDYYTTGRGKGTAQTALRRAREYASGIAPAFADAGMPIDLLAIAAVESVFDADANNRGSGAAGMWQFLAGTARDYGLRVDGSRDDRMDPARAAAGAASYLADLLAIFGARDLELAIGSYNCGDGRMRGILKRLQRPVAERSFWTCYRMGWLPEETAAYVPKVLAYMLILRDPGHYGLGGSDPFAQWR